MRKFGQPQESSPAVERGRDTETEIKLDNPSPSLRIADKE